MGIADKAKNSAEKLVGQGKEKVGDATDNDDLKAEGQADQAKGSLKNAGEDAKDAAGNVKDAFKK
ncbi:CsbD family protein [Aeromicrobium sp. Leaf350]|uniref:CsbD family protein n=1 Tax=Aeromicrobium sp. Leaf350 TaxID=2876565 RepID=UPI001E539BCE|nr:CsbD family protein [Aeromicrobium sp. Leaf350]